MLLIRIWITLAYFIINNIVTASAYGHAIRQFVPQLWVLFPRLRMVDYARTSRDFLAAILTSEVISGQTLISPLDIKHIVSPLLICTKVKLRLSTLSSTLGQSVTLVRASWRAILTSLVVLVNPEGLSTSVAVLKKACLLHHYDVIMGTV